MSQKNRNTKSAKIIMIAKHMSHVSNKGTNCNQLLSQNDSLAASCILSNISLARSALRKGAKVNCRDSHGNTALHYAVDARNIKLVALLMNNNANVNAVNNMGITPLMNACANGSIVIVKYLLSSGAETDRSSRNRETALTFAITWNRLAIVKCLLKAGANPNGSKCDKWTPLQYAEANKNKNIIAAIKLYQKTYIE